MKFVISDNSCMFAMSTPKTINEHRDSGIFCTILSAIIFSDIRLSNPYWITTFRCCNLSLARREAIAFLNFIKSNFIQLMPKTSENLSKGSVASLSSTPTSAKTASKSQSKLEKEIIAIQNKVAKLQSECDTERAEKYRLLCYIDRYCSALLSYFTENNPLDSQDWKKLHKQHLDLRDAIK